MIQIIKPTFPNSNLRVSPYCKGHYILFDHRSWNYAQYKFTNLLIVQFSIYNLFYILCDCMQVVKDHETGTSRGFAFVPFSDTDSGNLLD